MIATAAESVDAGAGGTRVATAAPRDAGTAVSLPDAGTRVVASTPPPDAGARWTSSTLEDGSHTCRTSRDCRRPQICMGPPGCGEVWSCQRPPDACMRDTQYFCDCEGESFTASMNCPGRPFAHRGSCAIDQLLDLAGGSTH